MMKHEDLVHIDVTLDIAKMDKRVHRLLVML